MLHAFHLYSINRPFLCSLQFELTNGTFVKKKKRKGDNDVEVKAIKNQEKESERPDNLKQTIIWCWLNPHLTKETNSHNRTISSNKGG